MVDSRFAMRRFRSVMEQIQLQPEDTLYVLGDVIDRFPDGIEILQELMAMPNVKMLLGNHEYMMLMAIDPDYIDPGLHTEQYRDALFLWYDNNGRVTKNKFDKLDPQAQKGIFDYLRNLPLTYEISSTLPRLSCSRSTSGTTRPGQCSQSGTDGKPANASITMGPSSSAILPPITSAPLRTPCISITGRSGSASTAAPASR